MLALSVGHGCGLADDPEPNRIPPAGQSEITALEPAVWPTSGQVPIRIQGRFLQAVTSVRFGQKDAPLLAPSRESEVQVRLPSNQGGIGAVEVAVFTQTGLASSRPQGFRYSAMHLEFAAPTIVTDLPELGVGNPYFQAEADFDEDGVPDHAESYDEETARSGDERIRVHCSGQGGTGPFAVDIATPDERGDLYAADVDQDGHADLLGRTGSALSVWRGRGNCTFISVNEPRLGIGLGQGVALGDLNGDGFVDVVTPQDFGWSFGGPGLYVFLNQGLGWFAAPLRLNLPVGWQCPGASLSSASPLPSILVWCPSSAQPGRGLRFENQSY